LISAEEGVHEGTLFDLFDHQPESIAKTSYCSANRGRRRASSYEHEVGALVEYVIHHLGGMGLSSEGKSLHGE
jgi:hypothetical protein